MEEIVREMTRDEKRACQARKERMHTAEIVVRREQSHREAAKKKKKEMTEKEIEEKVWQRVWWQKRKAGEGEQEGRQKERR